MISPNEALLLTAEQIVQKTQISRPTLWRWVKKGRIPYYKIGGHRRYILSEVLEATRSKN